VLLLAGPLPAAAPTPPPAWIQRAPIPPPIVAWRLADVLGTPVAEAIVVDRDSTSGTLTVNVVDSRYDPPRIVKIRDVKGSTVRWLRAGIHDGLSRSQIAIGTTDGKGVRAAYLLRVGRPLRLLLIRTVRRAATGPTVFTR
jgi:hypothetical protein